MRRLGVILTCLLCIFIFYPLIRMHLDDNKNIFYRTNIADFAVVFGASIRTKGKLSPILKSRVDDAILLYRFKKVKKLVFSGSLINQVKPGEPKAMKNYALTKGVKASDIILDELGNNTYATIQFTRRLLSKNPFKKVVYISTQFHIPRIALLSRMVGINNFKVFYSPSTVSPKTVFNKVIRREIIAYWTYLFFYPFYKIDHYLTNNDFL